MSLDKIEDWKTKSREIQEGYFDIFGSRLYDIIPKSDLFLLKKKVGYATCGNPSTLPDKTNYYTGYNIEQLKFIEQICNKIIEKTDLDSIHFACTILVLCCKNEVCETTVFRIGTKQNDIFIDAHARVYTDWEHFMGDNKLPDCEYCYPIYGNYCGSRDVAFNWSPASSIGNKVLDYADTAGTVVALAGAGVFAASMLVTVGPAALAAAGTSAACTAVYGASRSGYTLADRYKHEQSVGLADSESRCAWINVGSSTVGLGTFAAIGKAQSIVKAGESVSNLATCGLHALTATSLAFSGFGFIDGLYSCVDKYNKGVLTKKDVFDLSCEVLFLFNAIASAKATTELVKNMSVVSERSVKTKLKQKKVNERRKAAKKRAKGISQQGVPQPNSENVKSQKPNLKRRAARQRAKAKGILLPQPNSEYVNYAGRKVMSTTFSSLCYRAAQGFVPRIAEIQYKFQKICHDFTCHKNGEITLSALMKEILPIIDGFMQDLKDDINVARNEAKLSFKKFDFRKQEMYFELSDNSTEKQKSIFHIAFINMRDDIENMINEAEQDIDNLDECLENGNNDETTESNNENPENIESDDDSNDDGSENDNNIHLNPEVQYILCESADFISSNTCKDLEDYGDVLDVMKSSINTDFRKEMNSYKQHRKAAQSAPESFDIVKYHKSLGITDDVIQHIFKNAIKSVCTTSFTHSLKKTCEKLKKERDNKSIPLWHVATDGIFVYYGPRGVRYLRKQELLPIVGQILLKDLRNENCKWYEDNEDIVRIEFKEPCQEDVINIIVTRKVDDKNNTFGFIMILK